MPEIEDRLRATLTTLADEVPASDRPRAGLDRRLAARRRSHRRVPALAAAAAAVVVAGVAVPVALDRDPVAGGPESVRNQTANQTESRTTTAAPESAHPVDPAYRDYLDPPIAIASHGEGESFRELAIALNDRREVCFLVLRRIEKPAGVDPLCEPLPRWGPGHLVETRSLRDVVAELPVPDGLRDAVADQLVFLIAPEVALLSVRRGDGTEVPPGLQWGLPEWGFALADFDGPFDGFGYTARDEHGTVLEEAIT